MDLDKQAEERNDAFAPGKLGPPIAVVQSPIVQLAADEARLYWLEADVVRAGDSVATLRGCLKDDCAASLVTYGDSEVRADAGFAVQGGELFFARQLSRDVTTSDVVAVRADDPRALRTVRADVSVGAIATDAEHVYYLNQTPYRIGILPRADGAAGPEQSIELDEPALRALVAHGDYLYWFGDAGTQGAVLNRARSDSPHAPEAIATGIQIDSSRPVVNPDAMPLGLAVDDEFAYFSENLLVGSIKRCAVAGARSQPETVVSPIRTPMGLKLDGARLYIEQEHDAFSFGLSGCDVESCAPQMLNYMLNSENAFAIDDRYIYMATTTPRARGPAAGLAPQSTGIVRLAKTAAGGQP